MWIPDLDRSEFVSNIPYIYMYTMRGSKVINVSGLNPVYVLILKCQTTRNNFISIQARWVREYLYRFEPLTKSRSFPRFTGLSHHTSSAVRSGENAKSN